MAPGIGIFIQMDSSHHPWLGDQAAPFTLLIAVDDASGAVAGALFCEKEDAHSYFLLIQGLVRDLGIPVALYTTGAGSSGIPPDPASLGCQPSSAGPWTSWGSR